MRRLSQVLAQGPVRSGGRLTACRRIIRAADQPQRMIPGIQAQLRWRRGEAADFLLHRVQLGQQPRAIDQRCQQHKSRAHKQRPPGDTPPEDEQQHSHRGQHQIGQQVGLRHQRQRPQCQQHPPLWMLRRAAQDRPQQPCQQAGEERQQALYPGGAAVFNHPGVDQHQPGGDQRGLLAQQPTHGAVSQRHRCAVERDHQQIGPQRGTCQRDKRQVQVAGQGRVGEQHRRPLTHQRQAAMFQRVQRLPDGIGMIDVVFDLAQRPETQKRRNHQQGQRPAVTAARGCSCHHDLTIWWRPVSCARTG